MKKMSWFLIVVLALTVTGCAKKTASEQLADDMKKASNNLKKEINNL